MKWITCKFSIRCPKLFFWHIPFPKKSLLSRWFSELPPFFGGYASVSSLLRVFFRSLSSFLNVKRIQHTFSRKLILESANGMVLQRQLVGTSQGTIPKGPTTKAKRPVWAPLAQLQVWKRSIEVGGYLWRFCFWLKRWAFFFWWWFHGFKLFLEFSFLIPGRFLFWTYFKCFNWRNLDQHWCEWNPLGCHQKNAMNWLHKNSWFKVAFSNLHSGKLT